ncbi:MAG: hypothetical protein JWO71_2396 [Candidatus Acidoferrum typicum]|nr:hypothetical protein [Candidatus Acidoferrum typicum]
MAGMARARQEFLKEETSQPIRVMANNTMFFEEIVEHDAVPEFLQLGNIDLYRFSALRAVAPGDFGRNRLAIGDDPIDDTVRGVALNGTKMIGQRVPRGFAWLGHQVGDVNARRLGFCNGVGNFRNEQVGKNAGVERTGAEQDQISLLNGFKSFG